MFMKKQKEQKKREKRENKRVMERARGQKNLREKEMEVENKRERKKGPLLKQRGKNGTRGL